MSEKTLFNRIGLALFIYVVLWVGLQLVLAGVATIFAPYWLEVEWFYWLISMAPMYCVAFPVALNLMKHLPRRQLFVHNLKAGHFMLAFAMTMALMYIGSIIGNIVATVLTNVTGWNFAIDSADVIMDSGLGWIFLISVVLAPIFEEILFRKTLIDRLVIFGDETAILISSIVFGLMHGNITQFFYATAIGLAFGFIYIRTGKVKYTIALHMVFNFLNGFIPAIFIKKLDFFAIEDSVLGGDFTAIFSQLGALLGFGLYEVALIAIGVAGFVLLIVNRRKIKLFQGELQLKKKEAVKYLFTTPCMLLFLIAIAAVFVLQVIGGV